MSPYVCLPSVFTASCPVLCSGNGQYLKGRCMCHSGWKGAECDVPTNLCIDAACSGHGTCIGGTCICNPGYKGESCEEGMLESYTHTHTQRIYSWCNQRSHWYSNLLGFIAMIICSKVLLVNDGSINCLISVVMIIKHAGSMLISLLHADEFGFL